MTKMTKNGVTTTQGKDQFQCERFFNRVVKKTLFQWDYRDANGKLHSGIAKSEEEAEQKAAKFGYKEAL